MVGSSGVWALVQRVYGKRSKTAIMIEDANRDLIKWSQPGKAPRIKDANPEMPEGTIPRSALKIMHAQNPNAVNWFGGKKKNSTNYSDVIDDTKNSGMKFEYKPTTREWDTTLDDDGTKWYEYQWYNQ